MIAFSLCWVLAAPQAGRAGAHTVVPPQWPVATRHASITLATRHASITLATRHASITLATRHASITLATRHASITTSLCLTVCQCATVWLYEHGTII
jgi:hypothetical protein